MMVALAAIGGVAFMALIVVTCLISFSGILKALGGGYGDSVRNYVGTAVFIFLVLCIIIFFRWVPGG